MNNHPTQCFQDHSCCYDHKTVTQWTLHDFCFWWICQLSFLQLFTYSTYSHNENITYTTTWTILHVSLINHHPQGSKITEEHTTLTHQCHMCTVKVYKIQNSSYSATLQIHIAQLTMLLYAVGLYKQPKCTFLIQKGHMLVVCDDVQLCVMVWWWYWCHGV